METNSRLDSVLLLSSMNLPGGELVSALLLWNCPVELRSLLYMRSLLSCHGVCYFGEHRGFSSSPGLSAQLVCGKTRNTRVVGSQKGAGKRLLDLSILVLISFLVSQPCTVKVSLEGFALACFFFWSVG